MSPDDFRTIIRYGNLSAEIVGDSGIRLSRRTERQSVPSLLTPRQPDRSKGAAVLGRETELADAARAFAAGRPAGFHAPCGFGKTALLQHIVAAASATALYLNADGDRIQDLLHDLVAGLYQSDDQVKLTPEQCGQLLREARAVIAVDDLTAGPEQVGSLLSALPGCSVVIGSARPVLGRLGDSRDLAGLDEASSLAVIGAALRRPISSSDLAAARRLVAAVDGQPLHLRQAAALVGRGEQTFESLAAKASADPDVLDRLSIEALAESERRALAVLAVAAGALLPANVVDAVGQLAKAGQWLDSLHRLGLAERRDDRFGLPVCKTDSYRATLLRYLDAGAAARSLAGFLTVRHPTAQASRSAIDAALSILEFGAEQNDWTAVAELARAAEAILFACGRWEAWQHVLHRGRTAAEAVNDQSAEAFFAHQLGSLAICQDRLGEAERLLGRALALRQELGEDEGAALSGRNLQLLKPAARPPARPAKSPPPCRTRRGRGRLMLSGAIGVIALLVASAAIAATHRGNGQDSGGQHGRGQHGGGQQGSDHRSSGPGTAGNSQIVVAGVIGDQAALAMKTLRGQGLTVTSEMTSGCTASGGTVIAQDPAAGTSVPPGRNVSITSCSPQSSPAAVLSNVVGMSEDAATGALQGLGLTVTTQTAPACTADQVGDVVQQDPAAGTPLQQVQSVTLAVCNSAAPSLVAVPYVVTMTVTDATTTLQAAGFTITTDGTFACGAGESGDVVAEKPDQGSAPAGSNVSIVICDTTG